MAIIRYTDADRARMRKEQEETAAAQAELWRLCRLYARPADRNAKAWEDVALRFPIDPNQRRTD